MDRFDVDRLDEDWPFEIDQQAIPLFKHPRLGVADIGDGWAGDPLFYPARPPAHWLMVAEVAGQVLVVPLAPSNTGDSANAGPSAATWPMGTSPAATGRTDDHNEHDS